PGGRQRTCGAGRGGRGAGRAGVGEAGGGAAAPRRAGGAARRAAEAAGTAFAVAAFHRGAAGPHAGAVAGAVQHRQLTLEAGQHDLGRVAFLALLVGPFAALQLALDIDLGALLKVFLGDLGQPVVEDHDAVPLGALLALAGDAVAPVLRGRQREVGDPRAVLGRADFRVAAEIA